MGLPLSLPLGVLLRPTTWGELGGLLLLGAIPGAAESGATNKMGAAAADKHVNSDLQPGACLGELHQRAAEAGGLPQCRAAAPEDRDHEHEGCCGGL